MQFWKDAIKSRAPPQHPIAIALHNAIKTSHIAPYHLNRIIEARVRTTAKACITLVLIRTHLGCRA